MAERQALESRLDPGVLGLARSLHGRLAVGRYPVDRARAHDRADRATWKAVSLISYIVTCR
jgi:hypothetical protein